MTMNYGNPFPGMDPYLEHRHIWPGFHNRLIARLADDVGARLPDNYRIDIDERTEAAAVFDPHVDSDFFVADALVTDRLGTPDWWELAPPLPSTVPTVGTLPENAVSVRVAMPDEVKVTWLYVQRMPDWKVVTVVEILSPTNKNQGWGRTNYLRKREDVLSSGVSLVEIDLLRGGHTMPLETPSPSGDYRILVCRGWERPNAALYPFDVRHPIPTFTLPLQPGDDEPGIALGELINGIHQLARYSQITRYEASPPAPEFGGDVKEWIAERLAQFRQAD